LVSKADELARVAKEAAEEARKAAEAIAKKMEQAQEKTMADMGHFSAKVEEALKTANEALTKVKELAGRLLTRWEFVILVLAITGAAAMLGLGLALLLMP
jgi:hypothetical protein